MTDYVGTIGNDTIDGTDGADHFDLSQGGEDLARGEGGDDVFYMGATFDSGDRIGGYGGFDILELDGDYSAGVTYEASQVHGIESVQFDAGHDYDVTLARGNQLGLSFDASRLSAGDHAIVDASQFGLGHSVTFFGGAGVDEFTGGYEGRFQMGGGLQATDRLIGGAGGGFLELNGDYSAGLVLENDTLQRIRSIQLDAGHDYRITLAPNDGASYFHVYAHTGADDTVIVNGSLTHHELQMTGGDGFDSLIGGRASDRLDGGGGDDKLLGGVGADTLTGGIGADRFFFMTTGDSTATSSDLITDLSDQDILYLKPVDADVNHKGNQAFHLVADFSGHAGELTVSYDAGKNLTTVAGDTNGDGVADLVIHASGDHADFTNFVL